jgi:hypothetical protein
LASLRSTARDSAPKPVFIIFLPQKRSPTRQLINFGAHGTFHGPSAFEILDLRQQASALIEQGLEPTSEQLFL